MMFIHFRIKRLISAYMDNELSPREREFVEKHLQTCESCKKYLGDLGKLSSVLKQWPEQELTPDLEQKIRTDFLGEKYKGVSKMNKKTLIGVGIGSGALATIIIFVLVGQVFVKAGFQGRLKDSSDRMGEEFSLSAAKKVTSVPNSDFNNQEYRADLERTLSNNVKALSALWEAHVGNSTGMSSDAGFSEGMKSFFARGGHNALAASGKANVIVGSAKPIYDQQYGKTMYHGDHEEKFFNHASGTASSVEAETLGWIGESAGKASAMQLSQRMLADKIVPMAVAEQAAEGETGPIIIQDITLPATGQEEYVIRNANVSVEVPDVQSAYGETAKISKAKGGYLAQANFREEKTDEGLTAKIAAKLILRIPKNKLEEALEEIKKLGSVKGFDLQSSDVSKEYKNLLSEFNLTKVVYDKLRKKYENKSNSVDEAIRVENELTPYERRMEMFKARMAELDNLISMSTVTVDLFAPAAKYGAYLKIEIDDLQKAYDTVAGLAKEKSGRIISGGFNQESASSNYAQVALRVPLNKAEEAIAALKKIGSVKGFSVDSKDPALDLAGKNLTGSASISLDLYVPEWKALWRENLHKARERMIEMFANMLGSAVNAIPAIILSGIGLVVFVVLLIVVIAVVRKTGKKNE
jgi:hypothetical protein